MKHFFSQRALRLRVLIVMIGTPLFFLDLKDKSQLSFWLGTLPFLSTLVLLEVVVSSQRSKKPFATLLLFIVLKYLVYLVLALAVFSTSIFDGKSLLVGLGSGVLVALVWLWMWKRYGIYLGTNNS